MTEKTRGANRPTILRRLLPIAAVLLLAMLCVAPVAANTTHIDHDEITWSTVDSTSVLPTTAGNYALTSDIELSETWEFPYSETEMIINLCLNGHVINLSDGVDGSVLKVGNNVILNLYDCNQSARHYFNKPTEFTYELDDSYPEGADLIIAGGVITGGNKIRSESTDSGAGGGIYIAYGGSLNMFGGNIIGNTAEFYGGGVNVGPSSSFTMYSGNITGNTALISGGGVLVETDSEFYMNGGTISNNSADLGGGVSLMYSNFTMNQGYITGNTAFTGYGGGVLCADSEFTMNNGYITNNYAEYHGGGVHIHGQYYPSSFTMMSGTISGNTAGTSQNGGGGGGIYIGENGSCIMENGNIVSNSAWYNGGGGIYIDNYGTFTMFNGDISHNTANPGDNSWSSQGGGVLIEVGGGIFTMSGGSVSNNIAEEGGGVYVASSYADPLLIMNNTAIIAENNELYLGNDKNITIIGDSFTGSVLNITGASLGYSQDDTLVKIVSTNLRASDIISQFALKGTHSAITLTADNSANVIKAKVGGSSSGGGSDNPAEPEVIPSVENFRVDIYNATLFNVSFSINNTCDVNAITIGRMSTAGHYIEIPVPGDYFAAGSEINNIMIPIDGGSYTFNVTVTNTTYNVGYVCIYDTVYHTPLIDSVIVEGLQENNIINLPAEKTGTLTATVKNGTTILKDEPVTWESLNKEILEIDSYTGVYTAHKAGSVDIKVTPVHNSLFTETVTITITSGMPAIESATIIAYNATIANVTFTLKTTVGATGALINLINVNNVNDVISVLYSEPISAGTTVSEYMIGGLSAGTLYTLNITPLNTSITEGEPVVYTHTPDYTSPAVTGVTISGEPTSKTVDLNGVKTGTLTAKVMSGTTILNDEAVIWESDKTDVLTITNGQYTALKEGTANITAKAVNNESAIAKVMLTVINTTTVEPELPIEEPTTVEPELPIEEPTTDKTGTTTITSSTSSITVPTENPNTAIIEDSDSGVTMTVTFKEDQTPGTTVNSVAGNVTDVLVEYKELSVAPGEGMTGEVNVKLNLILKNVTTQLPKMNTTINTTVKNAVGIKDSKLKPVAMITAETNVKNINGNLTDGNGIEISFIVPTKWVEDMKEIWYFHAEGNTVKTLEPIVKSTIIDNKDGTSTIIVRDGSFSTYGIAGKETETVTPQPPTNNPVSGSPSSGSYSGGSTLIPAETPTDTPTEQPTQTPTDVAPTDIPVTQPTQTPASPSFGVLAVLAGLGAVAVLRRR